MQTIWLFEYFASGLIRPAPVLPLLAFRSLFAIACLAKFSYDLRFDTLSQLGPGSFLDFMRTEVRSRARIPHSLVRAFYWGRVPAAAFLLLGNAPAIALTVMLIGFGLEYLLYPKNHTPLYVLISAILLGDSLMREGAGFVGASPFASSSRGLTFDPLPQVLLIMTVSAMYFSAGIRKAKALFLSGAIVFGYLQFGIKEMVRSFGMTPPIPRRILRFGVFASAEKLRRRWFPLMWFVLLAEISLPALLLIPGSWAAGVIIGLAIHVGFLALGPFRLLHFGLTSVSTYLLFPDPQGTSALLERIMGN